MKGITLMIAAVVLVSGCTSADLQRVKNGAFSGAMSTVMGSTVGGAVAGGSSSGSVGSSDTSYSIDKEKIAYYNASKTSRDYGHISITKTEKNPQGQTMIVLEGCSDPRVGNMKCNGGLYEVTAEGWLVDDIIYFNSSNFRSVVIPAGNYYLKIQSNGGGTESYVTGQLEIKPFVSNYVALELE